MRTLEPKMDKRLVILERSLAKLNRGQGMGYLIGMTVISTQTLKLIARSLAALASVAVPFIVHLQVQPTHDESATCALTNGQVRAGCLSLCVLPCYFTFLL